MTEPTVDEHLPRSWQEMNDTAKNNPWELLGRGVQQLRSGRQQMVSAAEKAADLALANYVAPTRNPCPNGPRGAKLPSARQMRRTNGQINRAPVTLVGEHYFDGRVVLYPSIRAPKRISGSRKHVR